MALANAAWMLAANGQRVLAIDWDLEAPGLQRYFQPYLRDPKLEASDGLMDFVLAFADAARAPSSETCAANAQDPAWYERYTDLRMFAYAVNWPGFAEKGGRLDFVPAGRQDAGYALRVNSFNWQHFYSKLGGGVFLEAVKLRLRAEYDYVLIDSRTGVSDTSGVCTVQMPNTLVVFFTLNEQSIHGAASTASSAFEQRRKPDGSTTLRVMPVPTRVDSSEKQRVDAARVAARERFDHLLAWLDEDQFDDYWSDVETPYIPFYSLEEVLAVFDQPRVRTSLLPSVEGLVSWLSEQRITELPPLDERQRKAEMARYLRQVKPHAPPSTASVAGRPAGSVCFVNYVRRDDDAILRKFLDDLAADVGALTGLPIDQVMFQDLTSLKVGDEFESELVRRMDASAVVLSLLSPGFLRSEFVHKELARALQQGKPVLLLEWVPVTESLPPKLARVELRRSSSRGGFRYLAREGESAEYRSEIYDLAEQLATTWRSIRPPDAPTPAKPTTAHRAKAATILVPIVAERRRVMRQAHPKAGNYGLRRRDWVPFPNEMESPVGEVVLTAAGQLDLTVQLVSLRRFREWLSDAAAPGSALVLIDALTAERPEYERQLLEWDRQSSKPARVIVCVPSEQLMPAYAKRYQIMGSRSVLIAGSAASLQSALLEALGELPRESKSPD
jgi:cellulose biosynthesis protein BcsQ